jgi:hypothetical protein
MMVIKEGDKKMPETNKIQHNLQNVDLISQSSTYKLSVRFNRTVTSISINTKLLSLWLFILMLTSESTDIISKLSEPNTLKNFISDFVNKSLTNWKGSSNKGMKGISDFISSCIFIDICNHLDIDPQDFVEFHNSVQMNINLSS